uniref:Uncharacterized protein n=1 Tax=Alexandrium catenella TaxID=2925 RepID=A0A7S1R2V8_ALECA
MKAHHGAFKAAGAFQAAARPLYAGAVCRQPRIGQAASLAPDGSVLPTLAELAEGPYFVLALLLDATTLCCADATCRLLRQLNRARIGPWRALGARVFYGLELEREGVFEQPASGLEPERGDVSFVGGRKLARIDWKGRFLHFRTDVPTFCAPFGGPEITTVAHPDEVAYFRCRLCTDILDERSLHGVYLEVEVLANPDNLSMAVVDFEAGGCSSVTFSPDTGAVIRERKVREAPRKVEGAYIQPLPTVPPGRRFHGLMGLYLHHGRLAFFRRCDGGAAEEGQEQAQRGGGAREAAESVRTPQSTPSASAPDLGPWETTGFISDLGWAEGRRLTPCLAFRDEGAYRVRVVCVGTQPPLPPERWSGDGEADAGWSGFDWEVGAPTIPEAAEAA